MPNTDAATRHFQSLDEAAPEAEDESADDAEDAAGVYTMLTAGEGGREEGADIGAAGGRDNVRAFSSWTCADASTCIFTSTQDCTQ